MAFRESAHRGVVGIPVPAVVLVYVHVLVLVHVFVRILILVLVLVLVPVVVGVPDDTFKRARGIRSPKHECRRREEIEESHSVA